MSSILTNSSAMVALQTLKGINSSLAKTQDEISTGKTVASAKDNAAVWSISKVMESDVAGFKAISSSLDLGESTVAVASKASEKITDLLTQMKEKIVSAQEANVDRDKIQTDIVALRDQISSVVGAAQFNGLNLLSNKQGGASVAQIVGNTGAGAGIMGSGSINALSSLDRNANGVTSSNINVGKTDLSTSARTLGAGTDLAATAATGAGAIAANATSTISIVGDTTTVVRGGNKVLAGDGYKIGGLTGISADISYVARDGDTTTDIASALVDRINNEAKKAGVSFSAELDTSGANPGVKITNKTTASITTTDATPMMMPSRVRAVRTRLVHITRQAACRASRVSPSQLPCSWLACSRPLRRSWASSEPVRGWGVAPWALSLITSPSSTSITRWARAATFRSWVMRITT